MDLSHVKSAGDRRGYGWFAAACHLAVLASFAWIGWGQSHETVSLSQTLVGVCFFVWAFGLLPLHIARSFGWPDGATSQPSAENDDWLWLTVCVLFGSCAVFLVMLLTEWLWPGHRW